MTLNMTTKTILFFCRVCNKDMVDKSKLTWHRQHNFCLMYDAEKDRPLNMLPVNHTKDNSEIAAVFEKYNIKLP